jgi:hypothetical protein
VNWSGSDKLSGLIENIVQHGLSQFSGRSVLLARVVRAEQGGEHAPVQNTMTEPEAGTALLQDAQPGIESDFPQRDHNLNVGKYFQFAFEERTAVAQFQRRGFIAGWCAVSRGRDPGIGQPQSVIRTAAFGLGRKSRLVEGSIEEIAGTISGEHTSCSIRAMRPGRQTKNQQPGRYIAERRNGFTPVIPIEERPALRSSDFTAVADQAGTEFALDYLLAKRGKVSFGLEH